MPSHQLDSESRPSKRAEDERLVRPLQSSAPLHWSGVLVEGYRNPPGEASLPPPASAILLIHLDGTAWLDRTLAGSSSRRRSVPGDVSLIPVGAESAWRWDAQRTSVHIQLDQALLAQVALEAADRDIVRAELIDRFAVTDPLIYQLAQALWAELLSPSPLGRLYAESLTHTLAVHLLREHLTTRIPAVAEPGQLAPQTRQRVVDYIEAHLSADLRIADIAACANLSPYHFTRLFTRSLGRSPHQYLIERRVARAHQLVLASDLPLSHIASLVGMSDQSQLTRHFTRLIGLPPGRLRRERMNPQTDGTNRQDAADEVRHTESGPHP